MDSDPSSAPTATTTTNVPAAVAATTTTAVARKPECDSSIDPFHSQAQLHSPSPDLHADPRADPRADSESACT